MSRTNCIEKRKVKSSEDVVVSPEHNFRMRGEVVWVTPFLAQEWMLLNTKNRRVRERNVKKLEEAMREGGYCLTHQGIAFSENGNLIDGQHRLLAIISTGIPCWMWVVFDVPKGAELFIDQLLNRSDTDNLVIDDFETNERITQTANMAIDGIKTGTVKHKHSITVLRRFISEHRQALEFSVGNLTGSAAPIFVRAAVVRAFATHDVQRLRLFCELITRGEADEYKSATDNAAIKLRNWILESKQLLQGGSGRRQGYAKGQNALSLFLASKKVDKLYASWDELFPLPDVPKQEIT